MSHCEAPLALPCSHVATSRHEPFGGIHPYRAVQAHQRNMVRSPSLRVRVLSVAKFRTQPIAVQTALKEAHMSAQDVDGIAFTRGPGRYFLSLPESALLYADYLYGVGMTGCLGVGSSAAKTLAAALNKPLVGVHHMVCSFPCFPSLK